MPINVDGPDGYSVEFPDGTPPEVMRDAMRKHFGFQEPNDQGLATLGDIAKSGGSAVLRSAPAVAGVFGDIRNLIQSGSQKAVEFGEFLERKLYGPEEAAKMKAERDAANAKQEPGFADRLVNSLPTSQGISDAMRANVPGANYDPQTTAGKFARTVGEFLPMAAAGPEALAPKLMKYGVGAGIASETAGQAAEQFAPSLAPYARAGGALLGGGAAHVAQDFASGGGVVDRAMGAAVQGMTREQIDDAARLMRQSQETGIPLTWAEASDNARLLTLQRNAESNVRGQAVLGPMMAARPQQVSSAVQSFLDRIAPAPANVSDVGPALARNAIDELNSVKEGITAQTRPLYNAASGDHLDPAEMARLAQLPSWDDALREVRGNRHLNREIAGLPDNNALVVDALKQRVSEAAENAASPVNTQASRTISASMGRDAGELRDAATAASSSLAQALAEQTRLRTEVLRPLQKGQLGAIADAKTTRGAAEALLPPQPQPHSAAETGRTTATLVARDPSATADVIRNRLEDQFHQSTKALQSGENQWGGANYRRDIYGTAPLRENVQAALSGLPNGQPIADGFHSLMETLEAIGRRQHAGSLTAFNQDIQQQLKGGGAIAETITNTAKLNPFGFIHGRYEQWMQGRNSRGIADFLVNPDNQQRLIELARLPSNAPHRSQLQAALFAKILQDGQQDDGAKPSSALIDAMMKGNSK